MKYDVIVVGGGIIGVCSAYFLAKSGQKVLLLERGEIAQGTTANSFAWANATSKTTDQTYHDLNAVGLAGYHALLAEFGAQALGILSGGSLQLTEKTDATGVQSLKDQAAALSKFGHASRWIDTAEISDLEPNLAISIDAAALFAPDDLCINAPQFTRFMADQILSLGGVVQTRCSARTLLASDEGVVTGLTCDQGDLTADNVLITTGPDTAATLGALTGYDGFNSGFPMTKVPGLLLTTPPVAAGLLRRLVYGATPNEVHILPEFNGGIKVGSDDMDGLIIEDQSPENLRHVGRQLLARASALLPALDKVDIDDCQLGIGVRAIPKDGVTIAGQLPGAKGLYLIATHSGITLAPAIGQLMAEMIGTGQTPEMLADFGLNRFAGFA